VRGNHGLGSARLRQGELAPLGLAETLISRVNAACSVDCVVLPAGLIQLPWAARAAISSGQVIACQLARRTSAAASKALELSRAPRWDGRRCRRRPHGKSCPSVASS
jgi:hypothetical protein